MEKRKWNLPTESEDERGGEAYTIPNEGCCSPEFPDGCVIRE